MKSGLAVIGVLTAAILFLGPLLAQVPATQNPVIGVWKQNREKSTYDPGPPPPQGFYAVRQYAAGNDGSIVAITMNVDPQGLPSLGAVTAARYDEKEYPQHTLTTLATSLSAHIGPTITRTISYKEINLYTVEIIQRQDGEIVARSIRTISRDGNTMTERTESKNPLGQPLVNVLYFDRQ